MWTLAMVAVAVSVAAAWYVHADAVRSPNALGQHLSSPALERWNLGTLDQRPSFATWRVVVWERSLMWNAAGPLGLALLTAPIIACPIRGSVPLRRDVTLMIGGLALFAAPLLVFVNLHAVHDYYQTSCVCFLLAALAVAVGSWLPRFTGRQFTTPRALWLIVASNMYVFHGACWRVFRRPLMEQDSLSVGRYLLGQWLHRATPDGGVLTVFGQDWSSEMPLHDERKGLVCPTWMSSLRQAWDKPGEMLGEVPPSAVLVRLVPGYFPTKDVVQVRIGQGGWLHEQARCCHVLRPAAARVTDGAIPEPHAPDGSR